MTSCFADRGLADGGLVKLGPSLSLLENMSRTDLKVEMFPPLGLEPCPGPAKHSSSQDRSVMVNYIKKTKDLQCNSWFLKHETSWMSTLKVDGKIGVSVK